MKVFVCYRSIDGKEGNEKISELLRDSANTIAVLKQTEHKENWKKTVLSKIKESDFVIFLLGEDTFESKQLRWEYAKSKELNKQIIGIKLKNASEDSILFCQGFQVFEDTQQAFHFLKDQYSDDRELKIQQYQIMVNSTEKVTDARMKVNNLFLTITSSILSVEFILGKTYSFIPQSVGAMAVLSVLALLTTYSWDKLVTSYGKLNTGKFELIDRIEKDLRTNMFEEEWRILTNEDEINYQPNTQTEKEIIKKFRTFIIIILIIEVAYLLFSLFQVRIDQIMFHIIN